MELQDAHLMVPKVKGIDKKLLMVYPVEALITVSWLFFRRQASIQSSAAVQVNTKISTNRNAEIFRVCFCGI